MVNFDLHLETLCGLIPYGANVMYDGEVYRLESVTRCGMVLLSGNGGTKRVDYRNVELIGNGG